jgi:hypothetical protein
MQLESEEAKIRELQATASEMETQLRQARTEIKTLSMKLAASRSAEVANAKLPSSAIKGGNGGRALTNQDILQTAQMKEDLYGDLTGLIIRGVKHEGGEDVFDCIQTGRNGSEFFTDIQDMMRVDSILTFLALHFKLAISMDSSADVYEEAQFSYRPQLDSNRDKDLVEMLPDYLAEEITFPRPHAAKFYSRVTKSLQDRFD